MKINVVKQLTSTWFLSLIIAIIIFSFFHENFKEYRVELVKQETKQYDDYRFFYDVNDDKIDDNVDIGYYERVNSKGVCITNDNGKILHTSLFTPYNLPDVFIEPYKTKPEEDKIKNLLYVIDYENDIYLGTNRFDTLLEQIFLDNIYSGGEYAGVPKTYDYGFLGTYDQNKDGYKDLYLYIAEGYRVFPRRLYCVDYKHNRVLKRSVMFGAFPVKYEQFTIDGKPYFVLGTQATSNMLEFPDFYLRDSASYFMVFDENLEFKFPPIYTGSTSSRAYFFLKEIDNQSFFFVLPNPYDESKNTSIKQISIDGKIVKEIPLAKPMETIFDGIFSIGNDIYYLDKDSQYRKINIKSSIDEEVKLHIKGQAFWLKSYDIDKDGEEEHFFRDKSSNKIYITRNDFSKPAEFELPLEEIDYAKFDFPNKGKDQNLLFVWTYNKYYTYDYKRDKLYLLKLFGFIIALFAAAYLFVFIIQLIVKYRIKQNAKITSRIKELEFYNVRSQMNPHFTLNTLNFISTAVLKNETEKAYDVITGFSNIIRSTLIDANKILRGLDEELKFVEDYLKIQKARFGDKFDFKIDISQDIESSSIKLPPFIIQIFVENSLKHGLKDVKSGGEITISVSSEGKNAIIEIDDNGVGRAKAKQTSVKSTGKGMQLTKEYIELINSLNKEKIEMEVIDKFIENEPQGLKVILTIPKKIEIKRI